MKTIHSPFIQLKEYLDGEDAARIDDLREQCMRREDVALKLELDYKREAGKGGSDDALRKIDEFLYFDGPRLIGYGGICGYGAPGLPPEITGMVHPDYRRRGIFTLLYQLTAAECRRRNARSALLLCDRKSEAGQRFVKTVGAVFHHAEVEMFLRRDCPASGETRQGGIRLRKATNADAPEIARQNALYFDTAAREETATGTAAEEEILLPEDEEKRGMTIYLAVKDGRVVGKVHLQRSAAIGAIYGLGILPEYRSRGYGRAVLREAVGKLKEENAPAILLQVDAKNEKALRLYQSCGFEESSVMEYYEAEV